MTDAVSETDEALVEAVARAVDATPFECRDHLIRNEAREVFISGHGDKVAEHDRDVKRLKDTARAAIAAVRAHDEARGMVLVPREPIASALDALPDGVWEVWTSNSYRRISAKTLTGGPSADGGVLCGEVQKSDGHPDLSWTEEECQAACDLVNSLRAAMLSASREE